ncbi:hypothetical protein VTK73DRAFT_2342 [Phialemonium thermophilum]|uniref:Uncharacterized protein n=1 Tax=Phialemonium thermophilum TaxID=223376 RepID=A0ABR3VS95_9PEZI
MEKKRRKTESIEQTGWASSFVRPATNLSPLGSPLAFDDKTTQPSERAMGREKEEKTNRAKDGSGAALDGTWSLSTNATKNRGPRVSSCP